VRFHADRGAEAATRVAADACGLSDTIGTLAEGKAADVIVVKGEPFNDISHMADPARIAWVVKGGSVVRSPDDVPGD